MHRALEVDEEAPVDAQFAQIRAELSMQVARLELRMTKLMFVCAIFGFALVAVLALPTLRSAALALFAAGSATQAYAVSRM